MENNIESYFIVIKEDIERLRNEMNQRFNEVYERFGKQDEVLGTILDIVRLYDIERKEIKSSLWELDRRVQKIEQMKA